MTRASDERYQLFGQIQRRGDVSGIVKRTQSGIIFCREIVRAILRFGHIPVAR